MSIQDGILEPLYCFVFKIMIFHSLMRIQIVYVVLRKYTMCFFLIYLLVHLVARHETIFSSDLNAIMLVIIEPNPSIIVACAISTVFFIPY
jgi:hypothetical protein